MSLQVPNSTKFAFFRHFGLPPFLNSISAKIESLRISFSTVSILEIDEITSLNAIYCQNINFRNCLLVLREQTMVCWANPG